MRYCLHEIPNPNPQGSVSRSASNAQAGEGEAEQRRLLASDGLWHKRYKLCTGKRINTAGVDADKEKDKRVTLRIRFWVL